MIPSESGAGSPVMTVDLTRALMETLSGRAGGDVGRELGEDVLVSPVTTERVSRWRRTPRGRRRSRPGAVEVGEAGGESWGSRRTDRPRGPGQREVTLARRTGERHVAVEDSPDGIEQLC